MKNFFWIIITSASFVFAKNIDKNNCRPNGDPIAYIQEHSFFPVRRAIFGQIGEKHRCYAATIAPFPIEDLDLTPLERLHILQASVYCGLIRNPQYLEKYVPDDGRFNYVCGKDKEVIRRHFQEVLDSTKKNTVSMANDLIQGVIVSQPDNHGNRIFIAAQKPLADISINLLEFGFKIINLGDDPSKFGVFVIDGITVKKTMVKEGSTVNASELIPNGEENNK